MVRLVRRSACLSLGIVFAVAGLTPTAPAKEPNPIVQLAKKLNQPVQFPGIDDPKTTLGEVLEAFTKKYDVTFDVNERAFQMEMGAGAAAMAPRRGGREVYLIAAEDKPAPAKKPAPPAKPTAPPEAGKAHEITNTEVAIKPIPKMNHVRLGILLQKILDRVGTPSGATYVLRREGIEITTGAFKQAEFYRHRNVDVNSNPLDDGGLEGVDFFSHLPLVQVEFDKKPLGEALQELADATDWNVVLDLRAAEKGKPVTATLVNVPLDTAVELLADMSGLAVLMRDKSLYVTTKENAEGRRAWSQTTSPLTGQPGGGIGGMGGLGGLGGLQGGGGIAGGFQQLGGGLGIGGGFQGGMGIGGGFQGGGGIPGQPVAPQSPPASPTKSPAPEPAKTAPPELAKMQTEIAKLQAEIAKLQAELARLQPRKSEPKPEEKGRSAPKGGPQPNPADRGARSTLTKPRGRPERTG